MRCSNCQHEIDSCSSFCGRCGIKITESPSINPPTDPNGNRYRIRQYNAYCGHCHQRVEIGSTFCSHCGVALEWSQSLSQSQFGDKATDTKNSTPKKATIEQTEFDSKDYNQTDTNSKTQVVHPLSTQSEKSDDNYCTHCRTLIPEGKLFCEHCGAIRRIEPTLSKHPAEPTQSSAKTDTGQQKCRECGRLVRSEKDFCTFCGARINYASPKNTAPISEHEAFGPWIYEINDNHPLPQLFSYYKSKLSAALMVFKIPRNIERREAHRFVHLYDAVVGVFETYVLILQRRNNTVQESIVRIHNVQAISNNCCLLRGTMTLYTNTMSFSIVYNTVSSEVVDKAIDLILAIQQNKKYALNLKPINCNIQNISHLLCHLVSDLKKNDVDIKLIAYQPETFKITQTTGFVTNDRELILIDHEPNKQMEKGKPKTYSYSTVYIPINQLAAVRISDHPDDSGMKRFSFSTRNHTFTCSIAVNNNGVASLYESLRSRCASL